MILEHPSCFTQFHCSFFLPVLRMPNALMLNPPTACTLNGLLSPLTTSLPPKKGDRPSSKHSHKNQVASHQPIGPQPINNEPRTESALTVKLRINNEKPITLCRHFVYYLLQKKKTENRVNNSRKTGNHLIPRCQLQIESNVRTKKYLDRTKNDAEFDLKCGCCCFFFNSTAFFRYIKCRLMHETRHIHDSVGVFNESL